MPESCPIARNNCIGHLAKYLEGNESILDVGCGSGYYGRMLREMHHKGIIHAIEIWPPYVTDHLNFYDAVILGDCRKLPFFKNYSLILCCDMIEHLERDEAVSIVKKWKEKTNWIVATMPIIDLEQGTVYGNVHETHRYQWKPPEVASLLGMSLVKDCGTCGLYEWRVE